MRNKPITTQPTPKNIALVLELLRATPLQLETFGKLLPATLQQQALAVGKRSLCEELIHLLNCEAVHAQAIALALLKTQPLMTTLHPEQDWGKLFSYAAFEYPALLDYFKFRRILLLNVLEPLPAQDWTRAVQHDDKARLESVFCKARNLALHELHHLELIQNRLETKT